MQLSTMERNMLRMLRKRQQSVGRSHGLGIVIGLLFVIAGIIVLVIASRESEISAMLIVPLYFSFGVMWLNVSILNRSGSPETVLLLKLFEDVDAEEEESATQD